MLQALSNFIDWLILPRSTYELGRLNKIHEKLNDRKLTPQEVRRAIYQYSWKCCIEEVEFVVYISYKLEGK